MRGMALLLLAGATTLPALAQPSIDLGGYWERWVGDQFYDSVKVPSSYRPIGTVRLRRSTELPQLGPNRRVVLVFEGVANEAIVRVNGREVGRMGPWIGYEFDVTGAVKPGTNLIEVEVTDWQTPRAPGRLGKLRRHHSGRLDRFSPRRVRAECAPELSPGAGLRVGGLHAGRFRREHGKKNGQAVAELLRRGVAVGHVEREVRLEAGSSTLSLPFSVERPALWSPESPELYTLRVKVASEVGEHTFVAETGLRDLRIKGNQFLLNGEVLVLKGVARHDLWKDQGYTLTDAQIEQDMRLIKSMGANSIRLVHYPNDRRTVQAAARHGLLVSEEPGLYGVDFAQAPRESIERGLRNLEAIVRRDWNSPALFCVMLANESRPTVAVMREARERVKRLKPDLFLSAPHVFSPEGSLAGSKRLFDEGGFDFYTQHPYTYNMHVFEEVAQTYTGKPLIFSEWGGPTGRLPAMLDETVAALSRLVRQGRLAGCWFWEWRICRNSAARIFPR